MSDTIEELEPRRVDVRTTLAAVIGLACMFGGIWLSDGVFLGVNVSEAGMLAMRVCTLAVYLAFFMIARWFSRCGGDVRWLFGIGAVAGLALFSVGAAASLLVMPGLEHGGAAWSAVGVASLLAVKCIGAPVSVGLVCLFARLDGSTVVRACTLGMLGAFALYSLFSQSWVPLPLSGEGVVGVSGALLAASLVLAMMGFGGMPVRGGAERGPVVDMLAVPGVVKRPIGKVVTPGFVVMLVFSAMMLGFLRNGFTGGDYHNDPVSFIALAALLAVACAWRGLRVEHVFYGALLCTAVGILLAPSVAWALPGLERVMCGLGTALFEVVSWTLVVWAARNSVEVLVAASASRLAATVGHLLGTVVVAVGVVLAATPADALFASEQLMVFIYLVLLVVLLKFPSLQAPFAAAGDASEYVAGPPPCPGEVGHGGATGEAVASATKPPACPAVPADPVSVPCDTIARTYRLTAREREVLELIAHGRNMPYMEQELVISRNTLKMHIRHIYTKLDVHGKQEIIDMVEALIAR